MSNPFANPNQEVESWKDAFYSEFRKVSALDLESYLDKEADQTLEKYNIKCISIRTIREPEFATVSR